MRTIFMREGRRLSIVKHTPDRFEANHSVFFEEEKHNRLFMRFGVFGVWRLLRVSARARPLFS